MNGSFQAIQISPSVYWVGAIDWALRQFHGYETRRGSTYNAYLVKGDDGYILIDTVKKGFEDELLARIATVCPPDQVRAIISNHAEMDHSGGLPRVLAAIAPDAPVYASPMGVKALAAHFGDAVRALPAKGTLTLLGRTFRVVETRMMHWPDSMWTYDEADRILFTNDAFGMHLAGQARWADEVPADIIEDESARYFANILTIYAPIIAKCCAGYPALGLDPAAICPDHGPCWRGDGIARILSQYAAWSNPERSRKKAVLIYDTMWHSTETMARAIADGIAGTGLPCDVLPLSGTPRSEVARALLDASALIVGTPTLNQGMYPTVADVLCYLKGLKFPIELGAVFGSHGWAPLGTKAAKEALVPMCKTTLDPLDLCYVPTPEGLARCREYGESIAKRIL